MFGNHWSAEQKKAYRAAFTIGRIADEVWMLSAFAWVAVCVAQFDRIASLWNAVVAVAGFVVLAVASYVLLPKFVRTTMPRELSDALVNDRFGGPSSPRAPRTYRELLRRWLRH